MLQGACLPSALNASVFVLATCSSLWLLAHQPSLGPRLPPTPGVLRPFLSSWKSCMSCVSLRVSRCRHSLLEGMSPGVLPVTVVCTHPDTRVQQLRKLGARKGLDFYLLEIASTDRLVNHNGLALTPESSQVIHVWAAICLQSVVSPQRRHLMTAPPRPGASQVALIKHPPR